MSQRRNVGGAFGRTGTDLLTAIRDDRRENRSHRAPRTTPRRPRRQEPQTRAEFVTIFGSHVAKAANDRNWSVGVRALVHAYIRSLTDQEGTGQAPEGLRGAPLRIVQQKFAMSVLLNKPKGVDLPGMNQRWFTAALDSAYNYRASLRSDKPAQVQQQPEPDGYAQFVFGTVPVYDGS